jgi:hypothetical protein
MRSSLSLHFGGENAGCAPVEFGVELAFMNLMGETVTLGARARRNVEPAGAVTRVQLL